MSKYFKALTTSLNNNGKYINRITKRAIGDLPNYELLVKVEYSSLNYKDALSATGIKGVTRAYPHTPGIDAAGVVEESSNTSFPAGTAVIITGYDLGMNTSGGFGQYIRVPSKWAIKCPASLSTKEAMMIGTAGLTAGLSISAIAEKLKLMNLSVIVTGATGGVGSIAVRVLSSLGAKVTGVTGKKEGTNFLKTLGAEKVILRDDFLNSTKFPLNKALYSAAVDVAGGNILSAVLASMKYNSIIAVCGNVAGAKFETSVFPFILRSNSLVGIDSAEVSINTKENIWNNFANAWRIKNIKSMCKEVDLDDLLPEIHKIIAGKQTGRVLIKL